jgi:hypothetical protein
MAGQSCVPSWASKHVQMMAYERKSSTLITHINSVHLLSYLMKEEDNLV